MTHNNKRDETAPLPFGSHSPAPVLNRLLAVCHRDHGPRSSRLLAPVLRKVMTRLTPLPVDICVGGLNLRCQFNDNYSEKKFVFTPWRYDLPERRLLRENLPADGVFLDIGANIGLYTLTAMQVIGAGGRILAFEPNPATRQRLLFNIAANSSKVNAPAPNVLEIGIADRESQFVLQLDSSNLGASSISDNNRSRLGHDDPRRTDVIIHCRPLLSVLQEQQISHIDVLKIDIEGAEDKAMGPYLREAPDALLARLVIIENSPHLWQEDIFALLQQRGYQRILHNRMNSVFERQPGATAQGLRTTPRAQRAMS
ncbi:FkbM family methyltransferase [Pseudohongiella sp.]|uniref:Methyltransferase FkbM domain-containing protein n=1 Tax=marine sediment metagenome TaxID=412755 RepID=A0A0F9VZ24_9ZZZZ|nr:FkbM family methyltransferase [Pseudohongiella sp.]HDZ10521.1 FkbM family methyltransferase [Pseudohongiella sp.]HEA63844.1 FkbM family methyltransferase [Pseudohongiella sp.]